MCCITLYWAYPGDTHTSQMENNLTQQECGVKEFHNVAASFIDSACTIERSTVWMNRAEKYAHQMCVFVMLLNLCSAPK